MLLPGGAGGGAPPSPPPPSYPFSFGGGGGGGGGGGPGGGGDGGGDGGRDPPDPYGRVLGHGKKKKKEKKPKKGPDGGGGDDSPSDHSSDVSSDTAAHSSRYRGRSSSGSPQVLRKIKEADQVKIPALPEMAGFRAWRVALRDEVVAASGRGDAAFAWIQLVEHPDATSEALAVSGNKFQSIDLKLKAALAKIAHGDLGRQLTQATEDEAKRGRPLKGRQALLLIYRYFEINEEAGVIYSITDLMAVRWLGDEKIETFLNSWIAVLSGMREEPPLRVKEELFLEQMRKSQVLREEVAHYDRVEKGDPDKTYDFLVKSIRKFLERKRHRQNRQDMVKALSGGQVRPGAAASSGPSPDKSQTPCSFFQKGTCKKGKDCPYSHKKGAERGRTTTRTASGGANRSPSGGGARGQSKGQTSRAATGGASSNPKPKVKSDRPCYAFNEGKCQKGRDCKYSHRTMTETEKREKSRSPSPSGAKKECNSWAQSGSCKFGDSCRFFHSAMAAAKHEKAAAAKASAPKAKSAPPKPGGAASGGAAMACVRRPRGEVGRRGSGITLGWTDVMHIVIDPDNQTKPCPKPKKGRVHDQHLARCDPTHCHASALRDAKELAADVGYEVPIKWPVVWDDDDTACIYEPHEGGQLHIDEPGHPTIITRAEGIARLKGNWGSYLHLGPAVPNPGGREPKGAASGGAKSGVASGDAIRGVALAGQPPSAPKVKWWLMDTGCGFDLVDHGVTAKLKRHIRPVDERLLLNTANGELEVRKQIDLKIPELGEQVTALVLPSTPSVLSIGKRCMREGYHFEWKPYSPPTLITPSGLVIELVVEEDVPYLASNALNGNWVQGPGVASGDAHAPAGTATISSGEASPAVPGTDKAEAPHEIVAPPAPVSGGAASGGAHADGDGAAPGGASEDDDDADDVGVPRDLKAEAVSLRHLMTHMPKNPWCPACQRAKMQRRSCRTG